MQDIRWKQRFENFEKAYKTLFSTIEIYKTDVENIIYKLALIQSFEFTFELAWKTMKDYLNEMGVNIKFPGNIIKEAFNFEIIENGVLWADMLEDRNSMSHEYNEEKSEKIINKIANNYIQGITQLYEYFKEKI